jgi:hypothetical protein
MRALTLHEPWASLMAHGRKRVETRSWRWPHALPAVVAIHAAKRWTPDMARLCSSEPFRATLKELGIYDQAYRREFPLGCIVGVGKLAAVQPSHNFVRGAGYGSHNGLVVVPEAEFQFGDLSPGRYGWIFERVVRLATPVPVKGNRMVWTWEKPSAEAAAIAATLEVRRDAARQA